MEKVESSGQFGVVRMPGDVEVVEHCQAVKLLVLRVLLLLYPRSPRDKGMILLLAGLLPISPSLS